MKVIHERGGHTSAKEMLESSSMGRYLLSDFKEYRARSDVKVVGFILRPRYITDVDGGPDEQKFYLFHYPCYFIFQINFIFNFLILLEKSTENVWISNFVTVPTSFSAKFIGTIIYTTKRYRK